MPSFAFNVITALLVLGAILVVMTFVLTHFRVPQLVNADRARVALDALAATTAGFRVLSFDKGAFARKGYGAEVEYVGGFDPSTQVTFSVEGGSDGWLQVSPVSFQHEMLRQFGATDVEIDDRRFDDAHEIRASEQKVAFAALTPDLRSLLTNLGRRWEFVFRVTPSVMSIRVRELLYDPVQLDTLVEFAMLLFDAMKFPERDMVVIQDQKVTMEQAICAVCGTGLVQGRVVRCVKCKTPHHKECWEFNGLCATFACGERRFQ